LKKYILMITLLITIQLITADIDYYPQLIVAELLTASWSGDADEAYTGIQEIMNNYHYGEVIPVRYYTEQNSGQYSSPSVENLIDDYSPSVFPSLIVNGTSRVSGTNVPVNTGLPYHALIEKDYYNTVPIKVEILDFNNTTGYVEVLITMLSGSESLQNATARFILIEDDVDINVTNLARLVEQQTFSLTGQNNTVSLNTTLTINPSWDENNLRALVYVSDSTGQIIQAASTYATPTKFIRAAVPNQRIDIGPSAGLFEVDYFALFNWGEDIDLTISVQIDNAPPSWFLTYCDDDGLCYFGPLDFSLQSGEEDKFHANIIPDSIGMMDYHFLVQSDDFAEDYLIPFRFITNDVDYLIIDGDGWSDYETYTAAVLEDIDHSYGIWDTGFADLNNMITQNFNHILWITGEREPALTEQEIGFLSNYLDNGNNLFITGQNIGKDLVLNPLYSNLVFYNDHLNALLISESTDIRQINGVAGDYISDGLSFSIEGGDGADNQQNPEVINAYQQNGTETFYYEDNSVAGIRSASTANNSKIVYLAFGYEAIDNHDDRRDLLSNVLNWFEVTSTDDLINPSDLPNIQLFPSYPNPFNLNQTGELDKGQRFVTIPFTNDGEKLSDDVSIIIYNIRGQRIKTLTDIKPMDKNDYYVTWDGKDETNKQVVSGIYFYSLSFGYETQIRKMLLIK